MQHELNEYNNISEDWGWFIDIESINLIKINDNIRKNKLETIIEEDEYEYYINNKNLDDIDKRKLTYSEGIEFIINACSKTIGCALLTYIMFILI